MTDNTFPSLRKYVALEQKLLVWRQTHPEDTSEEDALLDEMDAVWSQLTHEELRWLKNRPPNERGIR